MISGMRFLLFLFCAAGIFVVSCRVAWAQPAVIETEIKADQIKINPGNTGKDALEKITFEEQQLMQLNANLKNVIEENTQLLEKNQEMNKELKFLRGQSGVQETRLKTLTRQKDDLEQRIELLTKSNQASNQDLGKLTAQLEDLQKQYDQEVESLKQQLATEQEWKREVAMDPNVMPAPASSAATVPSGNPSWWPWKKNSQEETPGGVSADIEKINLENEALKRDAAKVHYNLGNIYYQQGEYELSAIEYERAVELLPYDADAHYNLAFVSSENLGDQETALKHYQQYLYLKPQAEDANVVKEKILSARMNMTTRINSPIEGASEKEKNKSRIKR